MTSLPRSPRGVRYRCAGPSRNAAPDRTGGYRLPVGRRPVADQRRALDGPCPNVGRHRSVDRRLNAFLPPSLSLKGAIPRQSSFVFIFNERIGQQSAGICPPGGVGIAQPFQCTRIRIPLVVPERDVLSGDVREDDEVDVANRQAAYSSAIDRASSRMPMPSSISSRVIVSGGHTMITFQCVIR
jgi:hypothetical protein